jgi:hypothetical protein
MGVTRPYPTEDITRALNQGLGPFLSPTDPLRHVLMGIQGDREALPVFRVHCPCSGWDCGT